MRSTENAGDLLRRWLPVAAALAIVFAVLSGCARAEVTDKPPRYVKSSGKEQVSQLGQGGTVRVALPEHMQPECLDPYFAVCYGAESLNGIVFEGLLAVGTGMEYRPGLAAEVPSYNAGTLTLEPTSVEVDIRESAAFDDGRPVTPEDVVWTYERAAEVAGSGNISPAYSGFDKLEEVEANEDGSVTITFEGAYSGWRDVLAAPVLPKHVYGEAGVESPLPLGDEPVGSGPFVLGGVGEDGISFTANPRYWMDALELPRLDGLELEYGTAGETSESLATNRADFGFFTAPRNAPDAGDLLRADAYRTRTETIVFNSSSLDEATRKAVSGALNRADISSDAGFNPARSALAANLSGGEIPVPDTWKTPATEPVSPGTTIRFVYPSGGSIRDRVAESVVANLESAGFTVDVRRQSPSEFFGATKPQGDFDIALWDFGYLPEYESITSLLPPESSVAVAGISETTEDRSRYIAATEKVLANEAAVVPLFVWPDTYVWSSTMSGPREDAPGRAFAGNSREWAFYK